jgi:outer membrane usher protein
MPVAGGRAETLVAIAVVASAFCAPLPAAAPSIGGPPISRPRAESAGLLSPGPVGSARAPDLARGVSVTALARAQAMAPRSERMLASISPGTAAPTRPQTGTSASAPTLETGTAADSVEEAAPFSTPARAPLPEGAASVGASTIGIAASDVPPLADLPLGGASDSSAASPRGLFTDLIAPLLQTAPPPPNPVPEDAQGVTLLGPDMAPAQATDQPASLPTEAPAAETPAAAEASPAASPQPAPAAPAPPPQPESQPQPEAAAPAPTATAPSPAPSTTPASPIVIPDDAQGVPLLGPEAGVETPPVDINPYDREIELTSPLVFRSRSLGDLPIRLTADDRFLVDAPSFIDLIAPLLRPEPLAELRTLLAGETYIAASKLDGTGISLAYDASLLSVVVLEIDPRSRAVERLFLPPSAEDEKPDIVPADFSAYLNINAVQTIQWQGGSPAPLIALNGAVRAGNIVFEGDGQFGEGFGLGGGIGGGNQDYTFQRNFARLVYDEPEKYRRWLAGDLTPRVLGQQGFAQIGGLGVVRSVREFNDNLPFILRADRQLQLGNDASVRILRNGVLFRELSLQAGSYDLSTLPLLAGSNDVQIEIRDVAGRVQQVAFQSYLDPIDLVPGDFEYAAYVGPINRNFGLSPSYDGPVVFSGFFRKAFLDAPAVGVGLQLSEDVQVVSGQTQLILGNGSRLIVDASASNSRFVGEGVAVIAGFDQFFDRGGLIDSLAVRANYRSRNYAILGDESAINLSPLTFDLQYTRSLNARMFALLGANYVTFTGREDAYRLSAQLNYNINDRWSVLGGIDYARFPGGPFGNESGFGANIALIFRPGVQDRAELRHETRRDFTSATFIHATPLEINSVGYGAVVNRSPDNVDVQGFLDYVGNRFDASIIQSSFARDFGGLGGTNVTSVRVGTTLAYADGSFGVGRRIVDSFALLRAHPTLEDRAVVAGQSIADNQYLAKSGTLGAAVQNLLLSYIPQSVQYDVEDPPAGYDIGTGVVRVRPAYRSGYVIEVGAADFASAFGVLTEADGTPIKLVGGKVTALDKPDGPTLPFFTNSAGRFAVSNLRPGAQYRVELFETGGRLRTFDFAIPADSTGLVDLKTVTLAPRK